MNARVAIMICLTLAAAGAVQMEAQTFRVMCGVSADGRRTYKDVYEYDYVTDKPTFPGGDTKFMSYINSTREYPESAYKNGIQGRVVCSFVVNVDGTISNIEVIRGVEGSLNAEAVRILANMPDWTPGKLDGQLVPVRVIHPIPFRK